MEYKGKGISNGKSLGRALIMSNIKNPNVLTREFDKNQEVKKVKTAILSLIKEYDDIIFNNGNKSENVSLAETYKLIIASSSLNQEIIDLILKHNYSAVRAVEDVMTDKEKKIIKLEGDYVKEKAEYLDNIKKRIIKKVLGINDIDISSINYDFILISKEVTSSMLLSANPKYIKGMISEIGNKTSHVAVLSRNMGIPAIFNINDFENLIGNNELIYIDGNNGIVIDQLNESLIEKCENEIIKYQSINSSLEEMKDKKAFTKDGKRFDINANAGGINDLERIVNVNPDGIGLFRSEFLYLNSDKPPDEELQFNTYKAFASTFKEKPVIIRTIDLGGDKRASFIDIPKENNPFLGYRGIRYCLDHKEIFKTQLRAILRASKYGNIMLMYPMISSLEEVRSANAILRETMAELSEEGISYNNDIKVGIMVEIPSVAIMADLFIDEVDFFSIGMNDLVQYTVAVDRTNELVTSACDAFNPGVIRLVKKTIEAKKDGKSVGICGEMASDPLYVILLVGLGVDEFSVSSNLVLRVKKYISLLNYEECKKIVEHVLTLKTGAKIKSYLEEYAKEVFEIYL